MKVQGVYVSSVGTYLPQPVSAEEAIAQGLYDQELYDTIGWRGTHVAGRQSAPDMAVLAARQALGRQGELSEPVESFLHSGAFYQGPDEVSVPGYIMRELGLDGIPSLDIRQGCNGMLAGVEVAVGRLTGAARCDSALITSAENHSTPLLDRWRGSAPGIVMGDGAAAVTLSSEGGFAEIVAANSSTLPALEGWHRGDDDLLPPQEPMFQPLSVGRTVEEFTKSTMAMTEAIELISKFSLGLVQRSIVDAGINASDVAALISVNADGRALEQWFLEPLGIPAGRTSWEIGRTVGHVGGCDQFISLDRMLASGAVGPGDHVILHAAAPGWTGTTLAVRIAERPPWLD
ncbi:ketoacyl-ACP synthase III family protein [Streptomyces sp. NPDC006617]|uniref:ketoacyl-ACP synthase III family protein n=1 Tax=Streptomyces sp. NPDC006617 TaxID=3155354 RepID=UPI0033BB2869